MIEYHSLCKVCQKEMRTQVRENDLGEHVAQLMRDGTTCAPCVAKTMCYWE